MSDARKGTLLAVASSFWAAAFLIPYGAASEMASREELALALVLCAAVIGTVTTPLRAGGAVRGELRATAGVSAALGMCTVVGNVAMAEALSRVEPAVTSVILQTEVLFVAALAALWLREAITARFALGAALALAGFVVMRLPGAGADAIDPVGAAAAAVAALSFSLMHVITRSAIHRIDPRAVNALRLWLAAALLALIPGNAASALSLDAAAWALAGAAAACGPFLGRLCVMYAVRYIPAGHARLAGLVSPVFAFILGVALLGSVPSGLEIGGGAVILFGVALPLWEHARAERARVAAGGESGRGPSRAAKTARKAKPGRCAGSRDPNFAS